MEDKISAMFFEMPRWEYAIEKGVGKDICKEKLLRLCKPETRAEMYTAMLNGEYEIAPPHTALIPKDTPGEFRTVYINEPIDRIWLSIANDLLFDLMPEMVHPACKSYLKGVGCGKIVQSISKKMGEGSGIMGWKSDLSKYFDSVPVRFIDAAFDKVEEKHGHSVVIDVLRKYYHSDIYFDTEGNLCESYQSLKQGCSVASWLADVILYDIDEALTSMKGSYVRYSDDTLYIGEDYAEAMETMKRMLAEKEMKLNPKKVEYVSPDKWFKFLGFSIKGSSISLSKTRLKTFQKEVEKRTIKKKGQTFGKAVGAVNRYLYKGVGEFSWASQILPVVNVKHDIDELSKFVMDCLRAVKTGKKKVGGLGYVPTRSDGCIERGLGRNVKANRGKVEKIDDFISIGCMQKAMMTSRPAYNTLVSQL